MNRHQVLSQSRPWDYKYIRLSLSRNIVMILLLATTILIHETTSRSVFAIENDQEKQDATVNLPDNDFNYNNENKFASDIVNETNIISGDRKTITTIGNKILQNKQFKLDRETQQTIPNSQTILLKELRAYSHQQDLSNPSSTILSEKASNQDFIAVTDTNSNNYLIRDLVRNKFQQRQQELLNVLKQNKSKQEQILSQSDSSGVVGDTFGDTNKLRQELLIDPIIVGTKTRLSVASPASTAGTPSAYGASSRQAYIGGGLRFPLDSDRDRTDGSLSLGIGEGDAVKSLGIEFNLNITSVGGGNDFDFGDSGSLGFKLHKYFGKGTGVAFGWSNPIRWGDSSIGKPTVYGVVTQAFPLMAKNKLPLTVSIGVGSGAFRSKGAILSRDNSPNLFGSVGLQVIPQLSLVSSWTGNRLNVGVSVVPVKKIPFVINAIFSDVTDNLNGGSGLTITAGSGFNF